MFLPLFLVFSLSLSLSLSYKILKQEYRSMCLVCVFSLFRFFPLSLFLTNSVYLPSANANAVDYCACASCYCIRSHTIMHVCLSCTIFSIDFPFMLKNALSGLYLEVFD